MDIEKLQKMSIYELRGVARSLGVKSPTTFRKNDLITQIINIQEGKLTAHYTKRGRPPYVKNCIDYNSFDIERIDNLLQNLRNEIITILTKNK